MSRIVSPRDIFGCELINIGKENPHIFVLNADVSKATKTEAFGREFPERYLNVGIAEQNMIGIAAGLARVGFIPIVSAFAAFVPGRCYDQIRQMISYSNANVKICSTHPGLAVGSDGAIHQALDDISLMRELPNFLVLAPSDAYETDWALREAVHHTGPVYVRIGRKECPDIISRQDKSIIGNSVLVREGNDVSILAHGSMVPIAVEASIELSTKGIAVRVVSMPSIKPICKEAIIKAASETAGIVIAEDHFAFGGLLSAVCEVTAQNLPCRVEGVTVNDTYGESAAPDQLYAKYGLTKENIINKCLLLLNKG